MKSLKRGVLPVFLVVFLGSTWRGTELAPTNEHLVMAVLWYQHAAEMRALYYQAFHAAGMQIDIDHKTRKGKKPGAVIVDVDETVLDNSPHSAKMILENKSFPYAWTDWVNRAEAEALPGAVEFLNNAVAKGYDAFYVSNRSAETEMEGTIRNLRCKGFPQVDSTRVLLRTQESSKETRRRQIMKTHDIVVLIGDNLNDHAEVFEKRSIDERFAETDRLREEFGARFIVLPNPLYGEWESAIYRYQRGLTQEQKEHLRRSALKGF